MTSERGTSSSRRLWSLGVLALALSSTVLACKRPKPIPASRVWLGPTGGCAILRERDTVCWGANESGQLGDGTKNDRPIPSAAPFSKPKELALGATSGCGIFEDGSSRCWGDAAIAIPERDLANVAVSGGHVCAVAKDRSALHCYGSDREGQRMDLAGAEVKSVALGEGHTCVATARDVTCRGRPIAAPREPLLVGASVTALAAGRSHTCALLEGGSVRCWGENDRGQLGDGSNANASAPVSVMGVDGAVQIAAGSRHTCARLRNGTITCWGDNTAHQLADGTTKPSARPLSLPGLVGVKELVASGDSACARLADGDVRCWGRNSGHELGDGTTIDHDVPMPVKLPFERR